MFTIALLPPGFTGNKENPSRGIFHFKKLRSCGPSWGFFTDYNIDHLFHDGNKEQGDDGKRRSVEEINAFCPEQMKQWEYRWRRSQGNSDKQNFVVFCVCVYMATVFLGGADVTTLVKRFPKVRIRSKLRR